MRRGGLTMRITLNAVLVFSLAVVILMHCSSSKADSVIPEQCRVFGEEKVFVNSVTVDSNGHRTEDIRIGTCDKGDPINIQVVEKIVEVPVVPKPRKLRPRTGGDYEYTASLKISME